MKRYRHSTLKKNQWITLLSIVLILSAPLQAAIPIDISVQRQLETTGQAHVLINLRDPVSIYADSATRVAAIAQVQASVYSQLTADQFQLKRQYSHIPALAGIITQDALNILQNNPQVVSIQLDSNIKTALAEGVPYINGDQAQALPYTGKGITVAILDSGIDTDHPDLADAIVAQYCFTDGACPPALTNESTSAEDDHKESHGSHVAGIITGNGTKASRGIAPDANIIAIKVVGSKNGTNSDMVAGLNWVLENLDTQPVNIVSMSLASGRYKENCDSDDQAKANAIDQLVARGVTVFAAAGNDGSRKKISSPACLSGTIAVGATYDKKEKIAKFSNSNALVDILAPGKTIISSSRGGETLASQGTSMATPMAAGVAALMLQANPELTPKAIKKLLQDTGVSLTDKRNDLEFKRIDALAAVNAVSSAHLSMEISTPSDMVYRNGDFSLLIKVTNEGPKDATDVTIQSALPPEFTFVSFGETDWHCSESEGLVTCTLPSLPLRASSTIIIEVTASEQAGATRRETRHDNNITTSFIAFTEDDRDNPVEARLATAIDVPSPGILDGSFEQSAFSPVWNGLSTNQVCDLESCAEPAHTGRYHVGMDGETRFYQKITLPKGVTTLHFWLKMLNPSDTGRDFMRLSIDNEEIFRATAADSYSEYTQITLDVSRYADDAVHQIRFDSEVSGTTRFFIDDVELIIPDQILAAAVPGGIFKFSAPTYTVNEGDLVTLEVIRTGGHGAVAVEIETNDDTGFSFANYLSYSEALNWDEGETLNKTVTISTIDNNDYYGNKTFTVKLFDAKNKASIGTPSVAKVTIIDNDTPASYIIDGGFEQRTAIGSSPVWITSSDNFGRRPGTPIFFCGQEICEIEPHSGESYVWFGRVNSQETAYVEQYLTIPDDTTLSFWLKMSKVGSTTGKDFMQVKIDDSELFRVTDADTSRYLDYTQVTVDLSPYADGKSHKLRFYSEVFGSGITHFFIDDVVLTVPSAGTFQFTKQSDTVNENKGELRIEVSRTGGSQGEVSVSYDTSELFWWYPGGKLTWGDGDTANKTFNIPIKDNEYFKRDKTFTIRLFNPTAGASLGTAIQTTLTIIEDDSPKPDITDGGFELLGPQLEITQENPVWHEVSKINGTPICGPYTGCGLHTEAHAGDGHAWFGANINDPELNEVNILELEIASIEQTVIIPTQATILSFWLKMPQASELETDFIQVRIDKNDIFRVTGTEAANYQEYTKVSLDISRYADNGVHTIAFYSESKLAVFFVDDVELISPSAGTLQFSAPAYTASESDGSVIIEVTRTEGSQGKVSVEYDVSDNFWVYARDTLTWDDGETASKTFFIDIFDDNYYKHEKTFKLSLFSPSGGASIGDLDQSTMTIKEDDLPAPRIVDGGFELENLARGEDTPWNQVSDQLGSNVCSPEYCYQAPYSGKQYIFLFGSEEGLQKAIDQDILIPTHAKTLRFFLRMVSLQADGADDDFLLISIDGNEIARITGAEGNKFARYTEVNLDIDAYADGKIHNVRFFMETNTGVTGFMLDEIELLVGDTAGDDPLNANLNGVLPVIIPKDVCLNQPYPLDLSQDIWADGPGLLNAINTLPELQNSPLQQNSDTGALEVNIEGQHFALLPLELYYTDAAPGLILNSDGSVIFNTAMGLAITAQPALQESCIWEKYLEKEGFGNKDRDFIIEGHRNGNLRLHQSGNAYEGNFLNVRPDWVATQESADAPLGFTWTPSCAGAVIPSLVFEANGQKYRQRLYPAAVRPDAVQAYALENFNLSMMLALKGIVQLAVPDGVSNWTVDVNVNFVERTNKPYNHIAAISIPDTNGDMIDDLLVESADEDFIAPISENRQIFCSVIRE